MRRRVDLLASALFSRSLAAAVLVAALAGPGGCANNPRASDPYAPAREADRNPLRAQELTARAVVLMDSEPERAEALLREALAADLYHGPAHNNLGVLFLRRGELYAAASEFEWAHRLMPGHPDPRVNLALTLERAGRHADAAAEYAAALEASPGHMPATQGLAALRLRAGLADASDDPRDSRAPAARSTGDHSTAARSTDARSTDALLDEIALRGETQQWRDWARLERARRARPQTTNAP